MYWGEKKQQKAGTEAILKPPKNSKDNKAMHVRTGNDLMTSGVEAGQRTLEVARSSQ